MRWHGYTGRHILGDIGIQLENTPAGIYLFKVNNRNIRTMYEIWSKLITKKPE